MWHVWNFSNKLTYSPTSSLSNVIAFQCKNNLIILWFNLRLRQYEAGEIMCFFCLFLRAKCETSL